MQNERMKKIQNLECKKIDSFQFPYVTCDPHQSFKTRTFTLAVICYVRLTNQYLALNCVVSEEQKEALTNCLSEKKENLSRAYSTLSCIAYRTALKCWIIHFDSWRHECQQKQSLSTKRKALANLTSHPYFRLFYIIFAKSCRSRYTANHFSVTVP